MPEPAPTDEQLRAIRERARGYADSETFELASALLAERAELVTTKARLDTLQADNDRLLSAIKVAFAFVDAQAMNGAALTVQGVLKHALDSASVARIGESPEQETTK